jgi:hypothetical protein
VLQLYLNYKLKSVAHLPWRQMTYKFLNTIIDDLFAFVIKMPTLHRLSVFRCEGALATQLHSVMPQTLLTSSFSLLRMPVRVGGAVAAVKR